MKLLIHSSFPLTDAQRFELLASRPNLQLVEKRTGDPETLEGDGVTVLVSEGVPRDLSRWPSLRWVQLLSAGANQLRGHPILESGIAVTTASGTHGVPIAQFVTCTCLMMAHQLPRILEFKRSREWPNRLAMEGFTIRGRTAGIIGYGSIGRECARQLHALGMRILCSKRDVTVRADNGYNAWPGTGDPDGVLPEEWFRANELDLMLPRCDLVVVTVPSTPSTERMFGPREFACLKPSARMIIVSRGGIVDEFALADSLRSGRLAEAAVDCFVREPLPRDHPFFDLPGILLTPHMSGVYDNFASVFLALLEETFEGLKRAKSYSTASMRSGGISVGSNPTPHTSREKSATFTMKITGITTRLIEIDPHSRYKDGRIPAGQPSVWRFPLITLHTDEGIDGHSTAFGPHGDGAAIAETLHSVYWPMLAGQDPLHSERLWQRLWRKQRHLYHQRDSLVGVIDVAIWDIRGKMAGLPIAKLIGASWDSLPCYATARSEAYTVEEVFAEAQRIMAAGFHGYKVQLRDGVQEDVPRLRAIREAVGDAFSLMNDPAGGYTYPEALSVGLVMDELNFRWFEEPLPDHNMSMLAQLAKKIRTPLLVGETVRLSEIPGYLSAGFAPMLRGDVLLKGGITGLRKLAAAAELFGVALELHTADSPLLDVANLHVGCTLASRRLMENDHPIFRWGIKNNPMDPDAEGYVHLPEGPGLGVELDLDWLESHTAAVRTTE